MTALKLVVFGALAVAGLFVVAFRRFLEQWERMP